MHLLHFAASIQFKASAFNHKAITQAHSTTRLIANRWIQSEKAFDRLDHEIICLNPEFTRKRKLTAPPVGVMGMARC